MFFDETLAQSTDVYHLNLDVDNDEQEYPDLPSFTENIHIIPLNEGEFNVYSNTFTTHEANLCNDFSDIFFKSDKIVQNGETFKLVEKPQYYPMIGYTKLKLIRVDDGIVQS